MPTLEHNAIVAMFRDNPQLAPRLLALLFHVDVPPHASARVVDSSLDQLIPVEFRADLERLSKPDRAGQGDASSPRREGSGVLKYVGLRATQASAAYPQAGDGRF